MLDETLSGVLASVQGARAVLLLGMDGMIVASAGDAGELPLDLVVASYADLVRRIGSIHREAGIDDPVEMVVNSPSLSLVLREATPEYALMLVLGAGGSLGRARFEMRKTASRVKPELEG